MRKSIAAIAAGAALIGCGVAAVPADAMHGRETRVGGSAMRWAGDSSTLAACDSSWSVLPCAFTLSGDGFAPIPSVMTRSFVVINQATGLPIGR